MLYKEDRPFFGRVILVVLGMVVGAFNFYMMVKANIGLSPWDCFCMGLSYQLPITFGQAMQIVAIIVLALDLLLKEPIGLGSIIDALLVGYLVDFYTMLDPLPDPSNLFESVLLMIGAMVIMGIAQWIYMSAGLSCGPRDALVVALGRILRKLPIGVAQAIMQVFALIAGILMGGPVGVGTVLAAVGTGPIIQLVFNAVRFEPRDVQHESIFGTLRRFKAFLHRG